MQLGDVQVSPVLVTVCPVPCQGIVGHQHGMFHPCCPAADNSRTAMPGPVPPNRVCTHHVFNETEDNLQSHKQFRLNKEKKSLHTHISTIYWEPAICQAPNKRLWQRKCGKRKTDLSNDLENKTLLYKVLFLLKEDLRLRLKLPGSQGKKWKPKQLRDLKDGVEMGWGNIIWEVPAVRGVVGYLRCWVTCRLTVHKSQGEFGGWWSWQGGQARSCRPCRPWWNWYLFWEQCSDQSILWRD